MLKSLFVFVTIVHGLIHLLGFVKAYKLADVLQPSQDISKPAGLVWLLTSLLFIAATSAYLFNRNWWWMIAAAALVLSQTLIVMFWQDAKFGTIANILILVAAIIGFLTSGCNSVQSRYVLNVKNEFSRQPLTPEEVLTETDIAHLPIPVRKYLAYTGAIGKSKPHNVRIEFDAKMTKKPGASLMEATSEQYNFFGSPTRLFFMKASQYLVPFRVLHAYMDQKATMVVRVASLFNVVDLAGKDLTAAETVTLLNDMCVFAPGNFVDKRLSWKEIDSLSARVTFENGPYKVSAVLSFNEKGELVNFVSEDRSALQDDGSLRKARWSTPVRDYKEIDGRRIPTYGEAVWNYPEGDFTYGTFTLKKIEFNVKQYIEQE